VPESARVLQRTRRFRSAETLRPAERKRFHPSSKKEFSMRMILGGLLLTLAALTCQKAVATAPPAATAARTTTSTAEYVDIDSYLTSDADIDAWYAITSQLRKNFDDVCGDTFCEGDYSNIESLDYRCSVDKTTGVIGRCVWVFAASNEEVNPKTGNIMVDNQHWRCRSPLAPKTRVADLIAALNVGTPIRAMLPGSSQSIYDGLVDCL
jgi:hypothetical protein